MARTRVCEVVASRSVFPLDVFEVQELEHVLRHDARASTSLPTGQNSLIGTSGADGTVSFSGVAAGSYTLQASKSGYLAATGSGSVSAGSTGSISITIQAQQSSGGGGGGLPGFPLEATILGIMLVLTIMLARKRIPEKIKV